MSIIANHFRISLFCGIIFCLSACQPQKNKRLEVNTRSASIYEQTNYNEPFRNQFHFSSKQGWMNDINGVWYYDGVYHMCFQHYPYSNEWNNMHWGYATSSDLLHWEQHNPAIEYGKNSFGHAYSGAAIIDSNNVSGLKTGTDPVFLLYFTDTDSTQGQSIVYSNDLGISWTNYAGNPLIPKPEEDANASMRRDPNVVYSPEYDLYVLTVFRENTGMEFFTSRDLLNWNYTSTFKGEAFWECPDFFEMKVEGSDEKKYVFVAATGSYYVGDFNGMEFIPCRMEVQKMFNIVDCYAGQTFSNIPGQKIIQMAWLGMWNRNIEKLNNNSWNHAATFPVELTLYKGGETQYFIKRNPIGAIDSLVSESHSFSKLEILNDEHPFEHLNLPAFDMEMLIDLTETRASVIEFQISDKTILYNVDENVFDGLPANKINGLLKIRILRDRASYEIFMNDGLASKAEEYPFDPENLSFSIGGNGLIKIDRVTFNELKSIW